MEPTELSVAGNGSAVIQVLDARGRVSNVNVDLTSNRDTLFPQAQGVSIPTVECSSGQANIDNVCLCRSSVNSSPFVPYSQEYVSNYNKQLFAPLADVSYATPAARQVADRMSRPFRA